MTTSKATYHALNGLTLTIDGLEFGVGDKLTILNSGFAVLMARNSAGEAWLEQNTGSFPAGPAWGELPGPGFTDDPVVLAMALRAWHRTGEQPLEPMLVIPTHEAARLELVARGIPSLDGVPLIFENGRLVPQP